MVPFVAATAHASFLHLWVCLNPPLHPTNLEMGFEIQMKSVVKIRLRCDVCAMAADKYVILLLRVCTGVLALKKGILALATVQLVLQGIEP